MKNLTTVFIALLTVSFGYAQQLSFTLDDAVQFGLQNSFESKSAMIKSSLMKNNAYFAITEGLPQFKASVDYNNFLALPTSLIPGEFINEPGTSIPVQFGEPHNADINFELRQLVLDRRYFLGLSTTKDIRNTADLEFEVDLIDIKKNLTRTYFQVLIAKESAEILEGNLATTQKLASETDILYKNGFVQELDVDRLNLAVSNIQASIAKAQTNYSNALKMLKFQMGLESDNFILTDDLETLLNESKRSVDIQVNPQARKEFIAMKSRLHLLDMDIKRRGSAYFPTVYAFAGAGTNAQRSKFDFFGDGQWFSTAVVGATLNVPIFDGLKTDVSVKEARFNYAMLENRMDQFESSVDLEVSTSKASYTNALNQLNNMEKNVVLAQKIYDKTSLMFKEGVGSSLELTNAERELITAKLNYVQAIYDLLVAKTDLEVAGGQF